MSAILPFMAAALVNGSHPSLSGAVLSTARTRSDVIDTDVSDGPNDAGTAEYGPEIPEGAITCKEAPPPQFGSKKAGN